MKKIFKFRFLVAIAMLLAMIAVFSVAVMFLWNALMPGIFGLPALNYWQTIGLVILARILFGRLGMPGHFRRHRGRGKFHHGKAMREKWMNMSEDERKEFLRSRREFSHHPAFFDETKNSSRKDAPGSEGDKHE